MDKISVVINTYNAASTLEQVLKTVTGFDEVVVCDMESSDNTVEIAEKYGCKVVTFPKADHKSAEPARTFAIQSASNPWVLVVDADELVTPKLRDYLYQHTAKADPEAGLYIPRKNHMLNTFLKSSYPDYQLRFFKREGTVWPPYVHTFPSVQGILAHIPKDRKDLAFIHLSRPLRDEMQAANNYTDNEIEKRAIKKVTLAKIIFKPMFRFFKTYVLKGSFRLGIVGYIQAKQSSYYKFVLLSKAYEKQQKEKIKIKD